MPSARRRGHRSAAWQPLLGNPRLWLGREFDAGKIRAKVNFDSDLAEARYFLVSSLFDHGITFRHKELVAATRAIRALPGERSCIPIVALTAHAMEEELERCRAAGMNDALTKPIDRAAQSPHGHPPRRRSAGTRRGCAGR